MKTIVIKPPKSSVISAHDASVNGGIIARSKGNNEIQGFVVKSGEVPAIYELVSTDGSVSTSFQSIAELMRNYSHYTFEQID